MGYGSIGKRHVNNLLKYTNSEVTIWSKRNDLKSLKKKNIKIFKSLDKCLSEKPDIAFITNETTYHIPIAKKLAKLGLDLFIEKPLSNKIKDVKEVVIPIKQVVNTYKKAPSLFNKYLLNTYWEY